jgi:hypothetical protein
VIETIFFIFRSNLALPKMGRLRLALCAHQKLCVNADLAISSQTGRPLPLSHKPVDISTISRSIDQIAALRRD